MARIVQQGIIQVAGSGETGVQVNEFEAAIKSVTSSTTVGAVFVYDTRNDSDSGAWRKKCAGLSWYDEALNQTTRGGRREFPSVALIVADNGGTSNVTIYDLDDPAMPMWMVINRGSGHILFGADMGSVFALNGRVYVGHNVTAGALSEISFADDFGFVRIHNTSAYNGATIADREVRTSDTVTGTTGALVSRAVNDVAATYLEGGELDSLGLVRPVVACATNGGVSVIHPNGDVYDKATTSAAATLVEFDKDGNLYAGQDNYISRFDLSTLYAGASNGYLSGYENNGTIVTIREFANGSIPVLVGNTDSLAITDNGFAGGSSSGLTQVKFNDGDHEDSASAHITSTYNTGYMLGDIRFAGLSGSGQSGDISADRSVKSHTLTKHGTGITDPVVATDAELRGITGFSASSYLSKASTTDFDFDTGDFSISLWVKNTNWTGTQRLLGRSQDSNTKRLSIYASGTTLYAYIKDTTTKSASADVLKNNVWQHVFAFRRGSVLYLFVDGKLVNSVTGADSINITPASNGMLVIGSETFDNGSTIESTALVNGSLSLVRISATAPTPQQVKEIYEAEKPLFRAGAKCLLLSSSTVSDLAYDKGTDLLYVSTEAIGLGGGNVFRGLESIDTIDSKTTFGHSAASVILSNITAANGIVAVGSEAHAGVNLPAIDVRGDINTADTKLPDDGKFHFSGVTTDATQTKIGHIVIGENETLFVKAKVVARNYDESDGNAYFAEIHQTFKSNAAGTSQTQPVFSAPSYKLFEDTDLPTGDVVLTVNDTNDTVEVKVTGAASYRFVWNATVEVQRISERSYER